MIYNAVVQHVTSAGPFVKIPALMGDELVGPVSIYGDLTAAPGAGVFVARLDSTPTRYVILAAHTPAAPSWESITGKPATFAPAPHTHDWAEVTGKPATFTPAAHTHALATAAADGFMPKADKSKLDAATTGFGAASTLVQRDASSNINANGFFAPSANAQSVFANSMTRKDYVDGQILTRALLVHTHLWADLTDKPTTFAPSAHTHLWADLTDKPATFAPSAHVHSAADLTSGTLPAARMAGDYSFSTLRLTSAGDASETSTGHALQTGPDAGENIRIDGNEILGLNNGVGRAIWVPFGWDLGSGAPAASHAVRRDWVEDTVGTYLPTPSTLMRRYTNGAVHVVTGTAANDAANKGYVDKHTVLWTGAQYMQSGQTADLSETVSSQKAGIVLVWSAYSGGAAQNTDFTYDFIPKYHATSFSGNGIRCHLSSGALDGSTPTMLLKYIYINNTSVIGHANNNIAPNNQRVLRAVIGV